MGNKAILTRKEGAERWEKGAQGKGGSRTRRRGTRRILRRRGRRRRSAIMETGGSTERPGRRQCAGNWRRSGNWHLSRGPSAAPL